MKENKKIVGLIIAILVCVVLLIVGIFMYFNKTSPVQSSDPEQTSTNEINSTVSKSEYHYIKNANILSENDDYIIYSLPFKVSDYEIDGELYLPKTNETIFKTVVISHGFSGDKEENRTNADFYATHGCASYIFSYHNFYEGSAPRTYDYSLKTEMADLNAIVDGILEYDFTDRSRLFLAGYSQGGAVSALVAASRPDDLRGVVLFYPALMIPDMARERYSSKDAIPETDTLWDATVFKRYFSDAYDIDAYAEISKFKKDVLLMQGDQDLIVPKSVGDKVNESYANCEYHIIEGAGHSFNNVAYNTNLMTVEFMQQKIDADQNS